jgi:hypothetical protein
MAHPTIAASCPHCGRGPGIQTALTAIIQTLRALAFDQLLTGWRWLALTAAVAGLLLVQHGASALRVARAIPGVSHDQLTRTPLRACLGDFSRSQMLRWCWRYGSYRTISR